MRLQKLFAGIDRHAPSSFYTLLTGPGVNAQTESFQEGSLHRIGAPEGTFTTVRTRRAALRLPGGLAILLLLSCSAPEPRSHERPNILFLLSDDQGIGDVGCYGSRDIRTPAIDRLAAEGVRFTRFYAMPECSPTRAALMTGRYPQRVGGLECAIGLGNVGRYDDAARLAEAHDLGLPPEETSIARLLKDAGFETAIFGKWHLGYERKFMPDRHGFDRSFGPLGGAVDYFSHSEPDGTPMLYENGVPVTRPGYLTDLLTEEAVRFLRRPHRRPFFAYVPFTAPHSPFQGPLDGNGKPPAGDPWKGGSRETYAAMVGSLDRGVGEILQALKDSGLAENTLVVFASDNGADPRGDNGELRGRKGGLFEGGIRVPCIVRWPGVLAPGRVSSRPGIVMDLTASMARVAGAEPRRPFDGIDLLSDEERGVPPRARPLFWRARRGTVTWRAVQDGSFKYVWRKEGTAFEEHLFDLERDPTEEKDLAPSQGSVVARLQGLLAGWEREVQPAR
jgi:N-acetylgalactosamine-6-sulfatase